MRWKGRQGSGNIEDRRGHSAAASAGGTGLALRLLPALVQTRIGRTLLVVGVVVFFGSRLLGIDLLPLLTGAPGGATPQAYTPSAQEQELAQMVSVVLRDTEQAWHAQFEAMGQRYEEPTLVLFTGAVASACGRATSAVGPFYCPADRQLYIDLSFFADLANRHGAPGDFAQAYVVAHEVGHHVQTLLGISEQVRAAGRGQSQVAVNALSVRQELQADCFAGIWGHSANTVSNMLDSGDLEEALRAASAIGDDRLQREAGRAVVPDSFTHGTSAQRVKWFRAGFESGTLADCDTFSAPG